MCVVPGRLDLRGVSQIAGLGGQCGDACDLQATRQMKQTSIAWVAAATLTPALACGQGAVDETVVVASRYDLEQSRIGNWVDQIGRDPSEHLEGLEYRNPTPPPPPEKKSPE